VGAGIAAKLTPGMPPEAPERMSTGVPRLDEMLGGGLRLGSTALVVGPTGSGKTTLGLHFLSRATAEEPGVFLGFYENPQKLLGKAQRLGLLVDDADRGRSIEFLWWPATEQYLDEIGNDLLATVRRTGARRVVVDGLAALRAFAFDKERVPAFLAAVANELRARDATCLFTLEAGDPVGPEPPPIADLAAVAENIVMLDLQFRDGRLARTISVHKARDSMFDPFVYSFTIDDDGISIGAPAGGGRDGHRSATRLKRTK
jgi:circadian clock protein KaiC